MKAFGHHEKNRTASLFDLKRDIDLRLLIQETYALMKGCKIHCLWHDDKQPSLHIYPNGYYCFGCGVSGDQLDWLMATRVLSFQEAIDVLTDHASVVSRLPQASVQFDLERLPSKDQVRVKAVNQTDLERHLGSRRWLPFSQYCNGGCQGQISWRK